MPFSPRRASGLPSWKDFDWRASLALESRLRSGKHGFRLPDELVPSPRPANPGAARRRAAAVARWIPGGLVLGIVYIHLVYILATSMLIIAYRYCEPSATVLMAYRKWDAGWKLEAPRGLPLKKVPIYLRSMLVAVEDDKFYEHHGIDLEAFQRAREINARLRKPLYGGSTLTMQVARTLFLVPVKSYVRKYFEVITAFELEFWLPKGRILELYFGYAEWGRGIFGIDAAARHYYGRGVAKLSHDEGARLIALLSSPIRYSPATLDRSLILRERYAYLYQRWVGGGGQGDLGVAEVAPAQPAQGSAVEVKPPPTPEPGEEPAEAVPPAVPGPEAAAESGGQGSSEDAASLQQAPSAQTAHAAPAASVPPSN
jgi:monofunctional biosynthetic peptidoglycan transglycosylase